MWGKKVIPRTRSGKLAEQARTSRGLTMRQAAAILGLTQATIFNVEAGVHSVRMSTRDKYLKHFGVDIFG